MYPGRVRGGPAQPGRGDPVRDLERAGLDPGRADVRGLGRPGGADARAPGAAVHPRQPPPGGRLRRARRQLRHRARLHQHAERAGSGRDAAARAGPARGRPDRAGRRARGVQPRADRRLHRRRRARRRRGDRAEDLRGDPGVEGRGPAGRPRRAAAAAGRRAAGSTCPSSTTSTTCRDGRIQRVAPNRPGVPYRVAKHTADGPGRVAVPEEAAGAAGRDGARALLGGDLPRLHPRLPVLPGRDDHPAGAGAQHRDHRGHGAGRDRGDRAGGGRACSACPAPTTPRSAEVTTPARRSLRGHECLALAAQHPGGRVQHRPGQRAVPQRPPLRTDLRAGGWLGAAAQGDQQDGQRGRPDRARSRRRTPAAGGR